MNSVSTNRANNLNLILTKFKILVLSLIIILVFIFLDENMILEKVSFLISFFILLSLNLYLGRRTFIGNKQPEKLDGLSCLLNSVFIGSFVWLTGGNGSVFIGLLLIPVLFCSLQFGKKMGYLVLGINIVILLFFLAQSYLFFQDNFQEHLTRNLVVMFIIFLIAVFSGEMKSEEEKYRNLLENLSVKDSLTGLYNHRYFHEILNREFEKAKLKDTPVTLTLIDIDNLRGYNLATSYYSGDLLLKYIANEIQKLIGYDGYCARFGGDKFAIIVLNKDIHWSLSLTGKINEIIHERGENAAIDFSVGIASFPRDARDKEELVRLAEQAVHKAKDQKGSRVEVYKAVFDDLKMDLSKSEQSFINTIKTLLTVINAKDQYTYGHSMRVLKYAEAISIEMGLPSDEIELIKYGAFLHDIGKIEIPRTVLQKEGALTDKEFDLVKKHPEWGADIVRPVESLERAIPYILYHHERYDGTGYPEGKAGHDIPFGARIMAVADSFDAMNSNRPYRRALSMGEIIKELETNADKQFDPEVVKAFISLLNDKKVYRSLIG